MFDDPNNESLSEAYIEKNFGFLNEPQNQPSDKESHAYSALNSPAVLEAIAEINATEYSVPKLNAKDLKARYQEQLNNFESIRRPALEREGQSALIIEQLRDLYTVRANVSMWELERAVREVGFLDKKRDFRVTKRELEEFPAWKVRGKSAPWSMDRIRNSGRVVKSNAQLAEENVRLFRGARGLVNAMRDGLSDEQYNHLFSLLEQKFVTPERAQELHLMAEEFRKNLPTRQLKRQELDTLVKPFLESLKPAERKYLLKLQGSSEQVALALAASFPEKYDPAAFKERVFSVTRELAEQDPSQVEAAKDLESAIALILEPENQKKLRLLDLLNRVELTSEEKADLLAPFTDKANDDALLNDVLNAHPIAERLWGDRSLMMASENIHYTKHYEVLDDNGLYKDEHHLHPKVAARIPKSQSLFAAAPIMGPYPFNSGIEEIMHWKLQYLAEKFLGFDLTSDLGIAQFDSFVHNFEVSPGEETLDRVHGYPPPLHTYDELPIIKFDGWDEADVPEDYPEYVAQQQAAKGAARPAH